MTAFWDGIGPLTYPFTPLASRKAPPPRLFLADGSPPMTRAQQHVLAEARRLEAAVGYAHAELADALANHDPELCVAACRRLQSLGDLLGLAARAVR